MIKYRNMLAGMPKTVIKFMVNVAKRETSE